MVDKIPSQIDLNTADENVLVNILKIPPRLARRIIALRPYESVDQLNKVWGISPELLQNILPLVKINQPGILHDLSREEIPVSLEPNVSQRIIEPEPVIIPDRSKPAEDVLLQKEPETPPAVTLASPVPVKKEKNSWKTTLVLTLILLIGAYFRFTGLNWDSNQHQQPDERFVTMVTEQIRGVDGFNSYFDTQSSTLNPLQFGSYTYGMFPLFLTRMVAEWVKMDNYDSITLVGRAMSGLFDLAAIWMLYLLGKRLYNRRTGLLAAALAAAAVLPIQLSHFYAVDSFSTVFVVASFYFALQAVPINLPEHKLTRLNLFYFGLFGFIVGLAGACKINTLPIFGVIVLAGIIRLITAWKKPGFRSLLKMTIAGLALSVIFVILAFRIFQPYAFSGPGFLGIQINPDWLKVIREVTDQVAGNSDWPPNTHWTDRSITYAWANIVTWGLGLPLGLAGFIGMAWAAWQMFRGEWRRHLLPMVWVIAYFVWQNAMFWRYMRYFLPIYPFIILFAAWALLEIFDRTRESRARLLANGIRFTRQVSDWRNTWKGAAALLVLGIVVVGTYGYAVAFTQIYTKPITRITASRWMLSNIPGPLNVIVTSPQGSQSYPVPINDRQVVLPGSPSSSSITIRQTGTASTITSANIRQIGVNIYFRLTRDEAGTDIVTEGRLAVYDDDKADHQEISYGDVNLIQGQTYYFQYTIVNSSIYSLSNVSFTDVDHSDAVMPVELDLSSQAPGTIKGTVKVTPDKPITLNRLKIGQFQQTFVPTTTTLKVSIYKDGNGDSPLAEASQSIAFAQPGQQALPAFDFPSIDLAGGQTYQIHYEITNGGPLHITGDSFTLETSWDDALPLNIDGLDVQGSIFTPLNLELYEPDTPAKRDSMIRILSQSDYIVIPSNRAYDAMPRLPLRYPMTLKYYQALFDCTCGGDELENRAYGLEPPFNSPLGFDLIKTFESPPTLGPLVFADQSADESFTVYDHPKVMIFKKSANFNIESVKALLNSVDLNQVVFQTPLAYNNAPNAMQLPTDRLLAQTNGGTWSALFSRLSLLSDNETFGGIVWYVLLFLLGIMVFPLVFMIFSGLPDRGYTLIRMAGLILMAWLAWILGSLKILPFTQLTLWLCAGLILAISAWSAYRQRTGLKQYFRSRWKHILITETIFLAIFLFSLSIRLGNPDLWHPWLGGEKPMDFSFFNAVLKSVYFPPENPWFSGHYINYYYYGYVLAAIPTRLLEIVPSIAYNLILPSWFAMTGIGVFGLGFNLMAGLRKTPARIDSNPDDSQQESRFAGLKRIFTVHGLPYFAGLIAMIAVLFLGNLYEVRLLWQYLPDVGGSGATITSPSQQAGAVIGGAIQVMTGQAKLPGENGRWYFDASRPILNGEPDTPIAEFPYFTFLYGDMHPHLLTMPFYALALGWMLSLLLLPLSSMKWPRRILIFVAAGLIFGSFRPSHTWDFPTFVGMGALVILWDTFRTRTGSVRRTIWTIIGYELAFVGAAVAFYWPFAQWFQTDYVALQIWDGLRTPLVDYLFVFGLALFVMISLLLWDWYSSLKTGIQHLNSVSKQGFFTRWHLKRYLIVLVGIVGVGLLWLFGYQVLAFGLPLLAWMGYLILFKRDMSLLRRITWILFAIGLSITLFVEVFVLKGDVGRSNTVFRFYDQAWFMFGLAISAGLVDLLAGITHWSRPVKVTWGIILGVIVLSAASYPLIATNMKITDRWPGIQNPPHTLDGAAFMLGDTTSPTGDYPAIYNDDNRLLNLSQDYSAILYMQDNVSGSPVIVEGHTEEYRWGSRFSVYTGLPSVIGWSWHVRQHNSLLDGSVIDNRINDVNNFYSSTDIQAKVQFLHEYSVKYIILGELERDYYAPEGIAKFQEMVTQGILHIVYGDNTTKTTTIYEVTDGK